MNLKSKNIVVVSQLVIILAFFAGMLLNYYTLLPIIDKGEEARLTSDLDAYCAYFYPEQGCNPYDRAQVDSLLEHDPYGGDLFILDPALNIIYAQNGESGNGYDVLESKYGQQASTLLKKEREFPTGKSKMDYDKRNRRSMYACYEPEKELVFFYAVDYRVAGSEVLRTFMFLLVFMTIGGFVVIMISYFIIRKIARQVRKDSLVQQELDTAAVIQKSMLPRGEKHLIQLDVNARLIPAKKVGGDFYSYLLRDGLLYFCIGDVSGKGVPASLFMSKAVTLFRSSANARMTPSAIAKNLNHELCIGNDQNMFITGIVGTMRVFDGFTTYVNAGHEPPVIWNGNEDSKVEYLECEGNIPFGVMTGIDFQEETYEIPKNGTMVLYTDGISEAKSRHDGLLGRSKLLELIDSVKGASSKSLNDHLLQCISNYESGTEQSDDITVLTFRNTAKPKEMTVRSNIKELKKIAPFVEEVFLECQLDPKEHILVRSGLDEALTNCVLYAYDTPENEIHVTASVQEKKLCFTIEDSGKPFNPLEYQAEPSEEIKVGGLGISIYKANFDDVLYVRENGNNVLKLIKNL